VLERCFRGRIAQLVRALASHARGRRFESYCDHHLQHCKELSCAAFSGRVFGCERYLVAQGNLPAFDPDGPLVMAVDYLIYSMASAELKTLSEESHEVLNSYKAIVSSNVRTLLA
jgi:hypothetical protein